MVPVLRRNGLLPTQHSGSGLASPQRADRQEAATTNQQATAWRVETTRRTADDGDDETDRHFVRDSPGAPQAEEKQAYAGTHTISRRTDLSRTPLPTGWMAMAQHRTTWHCVYPFRAPKGPSALGACTPTHVYECALTARHFFAFSPGFRWAVTALRCAGWRRWQAA
jgi:hypothetical protein